MAETTEQITDQITGEVTDASRAAARPAPSPAASAASRARRIGGRVTPAPQPAAEPVEAVEAVEAVVAVVAVVAVEAVEATPGAAPAWLRWAPGTILTAGAIAMAILVSVVSHGVWWGSSTQDRTRTALREQVLAAAKQCLAATNTYTYTDIAAFRRTGSGCTTGAFTAKFRSSVDSLITPNAPKLKFVQKAQINTAGVEAVSGGQWTVLMYGQLQITNVNQKTPRIDPFGAAVRMQQAGGRWRISQLSLISSPVN